MPDPIFADPRLVALYEAIEGARPDLVHQPGADRVRWLHGDAASLPRLVGGLEGPLQVDLETRDPGRVAWLQWTREKSFERLAWGGAGVEHWVEVTEVLDDQVTFRWTFRFDHGETVVSGSTLRFRSIDRVGARLRASGFEVVDVQDAPDRPGHEHVFVARRPGPQEPRVTRRPQADF